VKPLAITGLGVVSPIAVGREAFEASLRAPDLRARAFGPESAVLDSEKIGRTRVAEVRDFDATKYLGDKGLRNFDRLTRFLIVAGKHALEDAGVKREGKFIAYDPSRVGICSSTAYGSLDAITELNLVAELEDPRYINPARFPNTVINAAAGYVSIWEDLRAPNVTVVDGNCGALDAFLSAETHLAHRRADAFLVGGGEVLSEALYIAFRKLGVVAELEGHDGLHLGEGAAYAFVERLEDAKARNATLRGIVAGYATAFDPPSRGVLLVHAASDPISRALESVLEDAGIEPGEVDVVASSIAGLDVMDRAEREGIRAVLKDAPIAAPKRTFGETFGASGALGVALALSWFSGAPIGPMAEGRAPSNVRTVVVLTVGFYGNVSAVVLKSPA
jgi:3-oxoacyl-[acyl-carrier-protein] synthase II